MGRRTLAAAAALCLAVARSSPAQHSLVSLPLTDPAYAQLAGLERAGCADARISAYRPYLVKDVRAALAAARHDARCSGGLLARLVARFVSDGASVDSGPARYAFRLGASAEARITALGDREFRPLWRDVRDKSLGDAPAVAVVRGRITWSGGEHLVAVSQAYAQTDVRNDPRIRARSFRTTSGVLDFDEAYLNGGLGPLVLSIGRADEAWLGEGSDSPVLSANGPPIDRISVGARWPHWELKAIFGSLNNVVLDAAREPTTQGARTERFHRMIAGHALTYRPRPAVELTLGETALLGRQGGGADLAYANPVLPFVVTENDQNRGNGLGEDNNLTAFAGLRVHASAVTLGAELMVDDIQIDAVDRKSTPDQLAWRLEGAVPLPLPLASSVRVQYAHVNSFTYLRKYYSLAYQQYDEPLGSQLGPDADMLRGDAELWASSRLRLAGGVARWRRGARRIDDRPGEGASGHAGESFPSTLPTRPAVQSAWLVDGGIAWLDTLIPIVLSAELARIDHVNNQPASSGTYLRAHLVGTLRFRYP